MCLTVHILAEMLEDLLVNLPPFISTFCFIVINQLVILQEDLSSDPMTA